MDAKEVIRNAFGTSKMVTDMLMEDFSDAELLERPVPGANHAAWQLGHLVASLNFFGETVRAGSMPPLPDGFADSHGKENAASDKRSAFLPKARYLELLDVQRIAMLRLLDELDDAAMGRASPEQLREIAPKVADMMELAATHELMHAGQFSVVRRKLGKPVKF
ncbi:MAG: DinB family protein [Planctomycetes bacterium]|nr:DinB family protein [Planctomycetota bacterium]